SCIGPVRLDGDDREAVPFDQAACDSGTGAVELGCPMTRLAQQDHAAVGISIKQSSKGGVFESRQRLRRFRDHLRQTATAGVPWDVIARRAPAVLGPGLLANQ